MHARDNPFRIECIHAIAYRPQATSWPALLARLAQLRFRAAIVGPHGSGKSTLLGELVRRVERSGLTAVALKLDSESPRPGIVELRAWLGRAGPDSLVVLDGAEFLSRRVSRWLEHATRSRAGLLTTSHRESSLPTLVHTTTSVKLLEDLLGELLGSERRLPVELVAELFERHRGDVRACLFELYDRVAADEVRFDSPAPE